MLKHATTPRGRPLAILADYRNREEFQVGLNICGSQAREIGISHATLSRVERGHLPDLENYQKICKWLGVDVSTVTGMASTTAPNPVAQVHFRKAPTVSPKTAQALAQMILAAQAMLTSK
jgi:hypothetical protein